MPYTMKDAPVKNVLPKAALRIWIDTFNAVEEDTGDEDQARQAAWSNVKKAGYRKGDEGKWVKSDAADEVSVEASDLSVIDFDRAEAMSLPSPTPTKVYAEFKFIRFGDKPNANRDGFLVDDVSDESVASLVGSPIYLQADASDHPLKMARATKRAPYQVGTVVAAEKREDGVYAVGAFQREVLEDRGIVPATLDDAFSVSMEVIFDRTKAKYRADGRVLSYKEALAAGTASPLGTPDDRSNYDARYLVPLEFHAVALLRRGRNAEVEADVLRVAAAAEGDDMDIELEWSEKDFESFLSTEDAFGAALTSRTRKNLPKSAFAYVDENGKGHLPIHDAAHVRNALARLNQTDIPAEAKRKALRKILAAAKRLGVKVDKDADVLKQYGAHQMALEERMADIHQAFYKKHGYCTPDNQNIYIRATYDDYVIFERGNKTMQVAFKEGKDGIEFDEPVEVEIVYKAVKAEASKEKIMAEPEKKPAASPQPAPEFTQTAEFKAAVEARAEELVAAKQPEIAKAAVEAHVAREKAVADRIKELEEILPFEKDEKAQVEKQVRDATDDAAYASIKTQRLEKALKGARADKAAAAANKQTPAGPTLRGGAQTPDGPKSPFDVTIPEKK